MVVCMSILVIRPLRLLLRLMDSTMRTVAKAGAGVVNFATSKAYPGERGYFTLLEKGDSSPESMDEGEEAKVVGVECGMGVDHAEEYNFGKRRERLSS